MTQLYKTPFFISVLWATERFIDAFCVSSVFAEGWAGHDHSAHLYHSVSVLSAEAGQYSSFFLYLHQVSCLLLVFNEQM